MRHQGEGTVEMLLKGIDATVCDDALRDLGFEGITTYSFRKHFATMVYAQSNRNREIVFFFLV